MAVSGPCQLSHERQAARTSRKNSPWLSLMTEAVSPAALEPLPDVYTAMGACKQATPQACHVFRDEPPSPEAVMVVICHASSRMLTVYPRRHTGCHQAGARISTALALMAARCSAERWCMQRAPHRLRCELQKLGLGGGGVAQQQDVDVTAPERPVW